MAAAGKELQEWEKFKKNSTDKILKRIFAPEPKEEKLEKKKDDPNQWDMTETDDKKYDEKYDTYYDDPSLYTFEYTNNTDIDYCYYADMSDAKTTDKD